MEYGSIKRNGLSGEFALMPRVQAGREIPLSRFVKLNDLIRRSLEQL
jgi:hypothetical protein